MGLIRLLLNRQALQHQLSIEKIEKRNMKELNESKLRFFTNISHEFRTPLCLTVGPIDNLLKEQQNGNVKMRNQLIMARRNARVLLRLVDQIIDFRRLEAGKIKLQTMEVYMQDFLQPILDNFETLRKEKKVEFYVNYPDEQIRVWLDPRKVEQIIYNLLSNAYKHVTTEGSIALTVSRVDHIPEKPSLEGTWVRITIYNDGKQIPEEDLEKVFERFYKVDDAQLGSGIGLAYAQSLVELHKGHISVENWQNSGVAFNLYFRTGKDHLAEEEFGSEQTYYSEIELENAIFNDQSPVEQEDTEDPELSLLVVEDNDELREFFRTLLSGKYKFFEAENGKTGYEIACKEIPDIIISDLLMPEMDGFELCEKIKSNDETSHIPIILLTAKNTSEDKISGYSAGADAYVVKPFEISVLEAQIRRIIANRKDIQKHYG